MTALEAGAALAAVAAGAAAQGLTGIGFSLVCAPLLIAALGPREGVRLALVLSTVLNVALLAQGHRRVLVRDGATLALPAVAVTPLVAAAARRLDGRVLACAAGALTVASVIALASGLRWRHATGSASMICAGAMSAAMNVVGSIGGPPVALFALNAGWPAERARPTLQTIFLVTNLAAITSLGLPRGLSGGSVAAFLLALAAGWLAGLRLARGSLESSARAATLVLAAAGGAAAMATALL